MGKMTSPELRSLENVTQMNRIFPPPNTTNLQPNTSITNWTDYVECLLLTSWAVKIGLENKIKELKQIIQMNDTNTHKSQTGD